MSTVAFLYSPSLLFRKTNVQKLSRLLISSRQIAVIWALWREGVFGVIPVGSQMRKNDSFVYLHIR